MSKPLHRLDDDKLVSDIVGAVTRGDWDAVEELAGEATVRGLGAPVQYDEPDPEPSEVGIGDEFTAVVVHPNNDDSRDPVVKVNNKTTFLRFPGKENDHVEFGEAFRARLADKRPNHNLAVVVEDADD